MACCTKLKSLPKRLVFLGAPGSGKGTASVRIASEYQLPHLSTGDMFRAEISARTPLGLKAESYTSSGALVPDEVVIGMIENVLKDRAKDGFVFDGFPRTVNQGRLLGEMLSKLGVGLDAAIYLKVSLKTLEDRIVGRLVCTKCGKIFHATRMPPKKEGVCDQCQSVLGKRKDDTLEVLHQRWKIFEETAGTLVGFYREAGKLIEIDADTNAETMCNEIRQALVPA